MIICAQCHTIPLKRQTDSHTYNLKPETTDRQTYRQTCRHAGSRVGVWAGMVDE